MLYIPIRALNVPPSVTAQIASMVEQVPTPSGCSMPCSGNLNELCGGPSRLSFYKAGVINSSSAACGNPTVSSSEPSPSVITTSTESSGSTTTSTPPSFSPAAPAVVQGNKNFTYAACYVDSGPRTLSQLILANDQMMVEFCLQACSQYKYAGLEYGRKC